jgi:hypothetical protein
MPQQERLGLGDVLRSCDGLTPNLNPLRDQIGDGSLDLEAWRQRSEGHGVGRVSWHLQLLREWLRSEMQDANARVNRRGSELLRPWMVE